MRTPWGTAQTVEAIGSLGIKSVSTPGHGGIYVPASLLNMIPVKHRDYAAKWSGSEQWYEEDCAWAYVALAFPSLFTPEQVEAAKETAKWLDTSEIDGGPRLSTEAR